MPPTGSSTESTPPPKAEAIANKEHQQWGRAHQEKEREIHEVGPTAGATQETGDDKKRPHVQEEKRREDNNQR